ncbi:MAG: hypothetical protein J6S67_22160 [Methanobrevibacter sp.]|nr:hypothetical protein [Methanobrevibacter sp.]
MTTLTEQYRILEQDFFAYQKMLNEANKDLNKYYLENTKLKELLKECREHFITYKRDDLDKGYVVYDGSYLIAKISQVLANNQIQANTVACNKIQENEE